MCIYGIPTRQQVKRTHSNTGAVWKVQQQGFRKLMLAAVKADRRRENCWGQVTAEGHPEGPRMVGLEPVI